MCVGRKIGEYETMTETREKNAVYIAIGQRLTTARQQAGYTLVQIAAMLHRSHATISRWESGLNRIPLAELEQFAGIVGRPVSYFQTGGSSKTEESEALLREISELDPNSRDMVRRVVRSLRAVSSQNFSSQPLVYQVA